MSTEAMKLALEALKTYHGYMEPLLTVFGGPRVPAEKSTTSQVEQAIKALEEALAKQEQSKPVGCKYMFNVEVEGKANAVFDTADEAVRFAMHHVYLGYVNFQIAIDTLNQGQVYMYSYGFSAVNIVPVEKRKLPTTTPQQRKTLTVRLASYPESNGKRNWTAMFVRTQPWDGLRGNAGGITIDRGECWNRVAYNAERARFLLGERTTEPNIMAYGKDVKTPEEWDGTDSEAAHGIKENT